MARIGFGSWHDRHYDANDTVDVSGWRLLRDILPADDPERRALDGTLAHAGTPVERNFDSEGRQVRLRESDGSGGQRELRSVIADTGDLLRIVDARGIEASRHVHDMAGRKLVARHADSGA